MIAARFFAAFLLAASWPAAAGFFGAPVYTEPFVPVDSYPTRLIFETSLNLVESSAAPLVEREAQVIRVTANAGGCVILCPPMLMPLAVDLGVLPAGDYVVELWLTGSGPEAGAYHAFDTPLVVAPGPRLSFVPQFPAAGEPVLLRLDNVIGRCPQAGPAIVGPYLIEVPLRLDECGEPPAPVTLEVPLGPLGIGFYQVLVKTSQVIAQEGIWLLAPSATLQNGLFEVTASWETAAGERGPARLVQPPSTDSALFYFFSRDNWELMVKVLDGCAINGHYWVFAAASTDVAFKVKVTGFAGPAFELGNVLGQPAAAMNSITAFPCP